MRIGLWSDAHNFPSLPLMKLSAYHKGLGDQVEMLNHLQHYDRVYASKAHCTRDKRRLQRWCNCNRVFRSVPRFEDYDA